VRASLDSRQVPLVTPADVAAMRARTSAREGPWTQQQLSAFFAEEHGR
jgi:hypothetical protein